MPSLHRRTVGNDNFCVRPHFHMIHRDIKKGEFIPMTKICYEVADISGTWFPAGNPECDNEIIPIPSFALWGLGVSLRGPNRPHLYYDVCTGGAWVGEKSDGDKLMAPGPITALRIQ